MSYGMIGPQTSIDDLLRPYFEQGDSWIEELVEDETNLLLAALLAEMQRANGTGEMGLEGDLARLPGERYPVDRFNVVETDDLDSVSVGGAISMSPGDDEALVRYDTDADEAAVLGVGAKDQTDVRFYLKVDGESRDATNSPLGTVNDPFAFARYGGFLPFRERVEYRAYYLESSTNGAVDVSARMITYDPQA